LIPEFQDHANVDNDETLTNLAQTIRFHDNDLGDKLADSFLQTDDSQSSSHGPEEDNFL
jgi:hypothetical protein